MYRSLYKDIYSHIFHTDLHMFIKLLVVFKVHLLIYMSWINIGSYHLTNIFTNLFLPVEKGLKVRSIRSQAFGDNEYDLCSQNRNRFSLVSRVNHAKLLIFAQT